MANTLNWSLGNHGKGNYYADSSISTWNVDAQGNPHHQDVADTEEQRPVFLFYITPEGGVFDGGIGFNNTSTLPDEEIVADICDVDPHLYDATEEPTLGAEQQPRVESPSGFGHAQTLMQAKIAGMGAMHSEYKIPRAVRRQIREWVDKLEWPEGHEKEDARKYHVTVLTLEEYCSKFEKFMRQEAKGREFTFRSTGFDIFNDCVVLKLECDPWFEMAVDWGEKADNRELGPHRFPGGPQAHITVGYTVDGKWPQGLPNPNIEFTTKMFNINMNRTSGARVDDGQPYNHETVSFDFCPSCGSDNIMPSIAGTQRTGWGCKSCGHTFGLEHPRLFDHFQDPTWDTSEVWKGFARRNSSAAEELQQWLQTEQGEAQDPLSLHHDNEADFTPTVREPMSIGPHIDPPSNPYEPYNWAGDKTSGLDDEPSDLTMPADWEHKEKRVQELINNAVDMYREMSYALPGEAGLPRVVQDLTHKLDLLGLNEDDIRQVTDELQQRIMDSPDASGAGVVPETQEDWMGVKDSPGHWKDPELRGQFDKWKTEPGEHENKELADALNMARGSLKGGADYDKTVEWFQSVIAELGLPPETFEQYAPQLQQMNREIADSVPSNFVMPQGWERTPAEEEALIWQAMNEQAQAIMQGSRGVDSAMMILKGKLQQLNVPIDRVDSALQQFKQMAVQQEEMRPTQTTGVPNALPPEWTAKLRRLAHSIVGCFECGIDHPADEECPEVELNPRDESYSEMQHEWYDRAWDESGHAMPFPPQPMHWRHDHAPNVSLASQQACPFCGSNELFSSAQKQWCGRCGQSWGLDWSEHQAKDKKRHKPHANPDSWKSVEPEQPEEDEESDGDDSGGDGSSASA
jgi:transcription elongation factor Elf1